jgi:hypothetical protein
VDLKKMVVGFLSTCEARSLSSQSPVLLQV